jgi:hypothetical protein
MAQRRTFLLGLMVGSMLAVAGQQDARAAEWSAQPSMSVRGEYHSNLLLAFGPQQSTLGYWISPAVRFAGATESLQVSSRVSADYIQYYGGRDTTIYNVNFPLSVQYRDQRSTWGFNGGLTRDNTLRSELLQTGVVLAFAQRNLWSAAPSWTYNVTERVSAQSSYQYQNAEYENAGLQFGLIGYQVHTASETLSYNIRDRDTVQITGLFTRFLAPERDDMVSDTYGVTVGGTHFFSENMTLTASGGPRFISNRISAASRSLEDHSTVWVFNGKLTRRFERASLNLDIGRDIFPSGLGLLIRTDHLSATASYELTDHLTIALSGRASIVNPVASGALSGLSRDTKFFNLGPQINWQVDEYWSVETGYTYSRRELEGQDQSGESHAARFMVTYSPPKFSASR